MDKIIYYRKVPNCYFPLSRVEGDRIYRIRHYDYRGSVRVEFSDLQHLPTIVVSEETFKEYFL